MFDTGRVLTVHELENIRRSAAMAPLSRDETARLIAEIERLVAERQQITNLLADLPSSFGAVRRTLNELQRVVAPLVARTDGRI
jgi:hypothetical protein